MAVTDAIQWFVLISNSLSIILLGITLNKIVK